MSAHRLPRSIRNNNPLNIDSNPNNKWVGIMPHDQRNADQLAEKRFEIFQSQVFGFRAAALLLQNYQDRHGLKTIREIINRWAPPKGVDHTTGQSYTQNTHSYVNVVARAAGVEPDDPVRIADYAVMRPVIEAMAMHETGLDPRTGKHWQFDSETIDEGLRRAGVIQPSRMEVVEEVAAPAIVATAATADTAPIIADVLSTLRDAETHITSGDSVRVVFGVAVVVAAAVFAYTRYRKATVRNA